MQSTWRRQFSHCHVTPNMNIGISRFGGLRTLQVLHVYNHFSVTFFSSLYNFLRPIPYDGRSRLVFVKNKIAETFVSYLLVLTHRSSFTNSNLASKIVSLAFCKCEIKGFDRSPTLLHTTTWVFLLIVRVHLTIHVVNFW